MPAPDNGLLRILDAKFVFQHHELSPPLVIGKGTIDTITEAILASEPEGKAERLLDEDEVV